MQVAVAETDGVSIATVLNETDELMAAARLGRLMVMVEERQSS